ncbi:MAG: permease prefix domain 1-containing protein, partial [Terracidiphilus sp.]
MRPDDALEQELNFHIEELTQANIAAGMTPENAHRQALLDFGGREQVRQTVREVHVSLFAEALLANFKSAFRFIRKSPTFSLTVIVTLAIGIGVNSAMFSAIDAVVLRPLPFPGGDQLVTLYQHDAKGRDANHFVAPVRLEDWNRLTSTFQAISGYYSDDLSETSGPLPERV